MPIKDVFKISRKTFLNPTGWFGYSSVSTQFRTTWDIVKNLFSPEAPLIVETFEEAMIRLRLSEGRA